MDTTGVDGGLEWKPMARPRSPGQSHRPGTHVSSAGCGHWAKPSPRGELGQLPAPTGREGSEGLQGDKVTRWVAEGPESELSPRAEASA